MKTIVLLSLAAFTSAAQAEWVVKSRATVPLKTLTAHGVSTLTLSPTQPIKVTNVPSTVMTLDATNFKAPTITNAPLDFGTLTVASLQDNNLRVCGTTGKDRCGIAMF